MANGARYRGAACGSICRGCRDGSAETHDHSRGGGGDSAALLTSIHDGTLGEAGSRDLWHPHTRRLHSLDSLLAAAQESSLVAKPGSIRSLALSQWYRTRSVHLFALWC